MKQGAREGVAQRGEADLGRDADSLPSGTCWPGRPPGRLILGRGRPPRASSAAAIVGGDHAGVGRRSRPRPGPGRRPRRRWRRWRRPAPDGHQAGQLVPGRDARDPHARARAASSTARSTVDMRALGLPYSARDDVGAAQEALLVGGDELDHAGVAIAGEGDDRLVGHERRADQGLDQGRARARARRQPAQDRAGHRRVGQHRGHDLVGQAGRRWPVAAAASAGSVAAIWYRTVASSAGARQRQQAAGGDHPARARRQRLGRRRRQRGQRPPARAASTALTTGAPPPTLRS
jgi:hypothetical protein